MHPDDTVTPGDDLLVLAANRVDLEQWPTDARAVPDLLVDLLAAARRLQAEADALAGRLSARLADLGLVARPCRICGQLYAVKVGRRPRVYCRMQCELDSQTLAYRQRAGGASTTDAADG